jgi:uncharacterized protein YcsI (UPF0317 family)
MLLPAEPYNVWISALDGIDSEEFESILRRESEEDYAENLKWLIESNLVILWTPEATDFSDYSNIRVLPCGIGSGEDPNAPGMFRIEARSDAIDALQVDLVAYTLWSYLNGLKSLSDACQATADDFGTGISVDRVRQLAVTLIPQLLQHKLAFLELVSA